MHPADDMATGELDALLTDLDEADAELRDIYRKLAADPDGITEHEPRRAELHAKRLLLAQQVGLAVLARRKAAPVASAEAPVVAAEAGPTPAEHGPSAPPDPPLHSETPAPPPPDRASDTDVAQWKDSVRATGFGAGIRLAPSDATVWPLVLHDLMGIVGPPRNLQTSVDAIEEAEALDAVATDPRRQLWTRLPKTTQQIWLSMLVARTRALRDHPSTTPQVTELVKVVIARYPAWAKTYTPGHVNGLQVKHAPSHGSWAQDARDHWEALSDLLGDQRTIRSPAAKKKPRRVDHHDDESSEIDPGWRLRPLVQGRRALMVGGDPREPNRHRLERAFQLASLDWPAIDGPRKVESVVGRIRKGTYELLVVLVPFVSHAESEPIVDAAKSAGTPWAMADGYGVAAVRLALERFLGGPRDDSLPADDDASLADIGTRARVERG
jgi:hypothetical protein